MSLTVYKIFVTVAEHKSFLRAAQTMSFTQSAISHAISTLESQMGFSLFIRGRNGVELTDSGERLLLHARRILQEKQELDQEVAKIKGLETGSVRIGAFNSVCINWVPDIIKSFRMHHPNIDISVYQGDYYDIAKWVKTRNVDIGFVITEFAEELSSTPLHNDQLLCVTSKNFIPQHIKHATIDDIKNENLILYRKGWNKHAYDIFQKHNLSIINSHFFLSDDQSVAAMVENGFGICIMPELVLKTLHFNIRAYPFCPNEFRTIVLCTLKEDHLSPASLEVIKHIQLYIKNNDLMNI